MLPSTSRSGKSLERRDLGTQIGDRRFGLLVHDPLPHRDVRLLAPEHVPKALTLAVQGVAPTSEIPAFL